MAYEAFNRKFLNANKLQANSGAQEHFLQHSEASFVSTQLDPFCGMQKAEKISSKFSNCAITRQRKIKKKNQTDSTRQRNKVPFGLRASVSANKLNECRAAFCLAAVFLWCVLNHRNIVNQKS